MDEDHFMLGYLVGTLSDADRRRVDARLVADPEYFDRLRAFEDDLIHRWHRGHLSVTDRQVFEAAYASEAQRARIASSLSLLQVVETAIEAPGRSAGGRFTQNVRRRPSRLPSWAMAAAAIVACFGSAFAWWELRQPKEPLTLAVRLTARGERGPGPAPSFDTVRLTDAVTVVQLLVSVPPPPAIAKVSVEVSSNDRDSVLRYAGKAIEWRPADGLLQVTVAASDLRDGDYVVTVRTAPSADSDVAARQAIRVTRR